MLALAAKVRYVIDPDNPYPNGFTGHIAVKLKNGTTLEERQATTCAAARTSRSRAPTSKKSSA